MTSVTKKTGTAPAIPCGHRGTGIPFRFRTNILVNVLVLTGLLRVVLKMPDDMILAAFYRPQA
ncbi:MAG: hypothetical protein QM690_02515 [Sphingobium sp.]